MFSFKFGFDRILKLEFQTGHVLSGVLFCLLRFSLEGMPSFNLLICLGLVKKLVLGGGGWWGCWVVVFETNYSVKLC